MNRRRIRDVKKGDQFGSWTVVQSKLKHKGNSRFSCLVRCNKCNKEYWRDVYSVKAGKTRMCVRCSGKSSPVVIHMSKLASSVKVGQMFGNRKVIRKPVKGKHGWKVLMECACNDLSSISLSNLMSGKSYSCRSCSHKYPLEKPQGSTSKNRWILSGAVLIALFVNGAIIVTMGVLLFKRWYADGF